MPDYDIALILTIKADTYADALREADHFADGAGQNGENISTVDSYEHDNDGQRVLYLHPEDAPNA